MLVGRVPNCRTYLHIQQILTTVKTKLNRTKIVDDNIFTIQNCFSVWYQCLVLLWYPNTYNRLQMFMVSRGLVNTIAVAIVVVNTVNNHEHFDTVPFYFHEQIIVISIIIKIPDRFHWNLAKLACIYSIARSNIEAYCRFDGFHRFIFGRQTCQGNCRKAFLFQIWRKFVRKYDQ